MSTASLDQSLDPAAQILLDNATQDAMSLILVELPQATDMSLVRRIISERIAENIALGERDRWRLSKGAVSQVRQALQVKESTSRLIYGD
jgi:hypothetical protein